MRVIITIGFILGWDLHNWNLPAQNLPQKLWMGIKHHFDEQTVHFDELAINFTLTSMTPCLWPQPFDPSNKKLKGSKFTSNYQICDHRKCFIELSSRSVQNVLTYLHYGTGARIWIIVIRITIITAGTNRKQGVRYKVTTIRSMNNSLMLKRMTYI